MNEIQNKNHGEIQPRLQYNYCKINLDTGVCIFCRTYSYEVPLPEYILVPYFTDDYVGKYYHDGHWYADANFTISCPELDW